MPISIEYTGQHINFETFKSLVDIQYIRLRRSTVIDKTNNNFERLRDLNFITVSLGPRQYTECTFIIRFTGFWGEQILDFLRNNNLPQEWPDGEFWLEEFSSGNYNGDITYEYYPVEAFGNLFDDAVIQRAKEVEDIWYGRSLVIFKMDNIHFYEDGSTSSIPFCKNELEIEDDRIEEKDRKESWAISVEEDLKQASSWMDNPEDYWNID